MNLIRAAFPEKAVKCPLFLDRIPAGFPSPATDFIDGNIDLNDICVKTPAATFFAIASGLSMVDAGIYEGSLLVIDRSLTAKHGDIVIASVAGEYTVKRLCLHPVVQLEPMNPDFPPIVLHDGGDDLELFGVVTFSINGLR